MTCTRASSARVGAGRGLRPPGHGPAPDPGGGAHAPELQARAGHEAALFMPSAAASPRWTRAAAAALSRARAAAAAEIKDALLVAPRDERTGQEPSVRVGGGPGRVSAFFFHRENETTQPRARDGGPRRTRRARRGADARRAAEGAPAARRGPARVRAAVRGRVRGRAARRLSRTSDARSPTRRRPGMCAATGGRRAGGRRARGARRSSRGVDREAEIGRRARGARAHEARHAVAARGGVRDAEADAHGRVRGARSSTSAKTTRAPEAGGPRVAARRRARAGGAETSVRDGANPQASEAESARARVADARRAANRRGARDRRELGRAGRGNRSLAEADAEPGGVTRGKPGEREREAEISVSCFVGGSRRA